MLSYRTPSVAPRRAAHRVRMLLPRRFLDADIRRALFHYWRAAGLRPRHVLIPLCLSFVEAAFEGVSFARLIPHEAQFEEATA